MVYPREPSGGAWIACNNQGNLLALLNWNDNKFHKLGEKRKTRGLVLPELIHLPDLSTADSHFQQMNLDGLFPFCLVGIFGVNKPLTNGAGTARRNGDWHSPGLANTGSHQVSQIHWQKKSGGERAKPQRENPRLGTMAGFAAFIARTIPDQAPSRFVSTGKMRLPSVTPRYGVTERRSRWTTSREIPA